MMANESVGWLSSGECLAVCLDVRSVLTRESRSWKVMNEPVVMASGVAAS